MSRRLVMVLLFLAHLAMLLSACATAPTHPVLRSATLPELIPVSRVVANSDYKGFFRISPDGKHLLWIQPVRGDTGMAVREIDREGDIPAAADRLFATGRIARPVHGDNFGWLADSRHAFYHKDPSGAENTQIVIFDTEKPSFEPWLVTPSTKARSFFLHEGVPGSTKVLFASNDRDPTSFDVFEADFATRRIREIARNDGTIARWIVDTDGRLAGRIRQLGRKDGSDRVAEVAEDPDETVVRWRTVAKIDGFDLWHPLRIDRKQRRLYAHSNIGLDKSALKEIDLGGGTERVLFERERVDVGHTLFPRSRGAPYAATTTPDYPKIDYFESAAAVEMKAAVDQAVALAREQGVILEDPVRAMPDTVSEDTQRMVVKILSAYGISELLFDRRTGTMRPLRTPAPDAGRLLSPMVPFFFRASDGLEIPGYVIRPRGVTGPAPLVAIPHGGPWERDFWSAGDFDLNQLLANRGYAVLKVNYRGSAGYGRAFMAAGARRTAGRVQQDIAEAVQWAIDHGIADSRRIAVFGASFGGFSALMQLIEKPHPYVCGINLVGVANWPRVLETLPPYWRNRHYFEWFYGRPDDPSEREEMWRGSPLSRIGEITVPLLVIHGANDVRVLKQDSEEVVSELRKLGRPVRYLVFENEGHHVRRWYNRLAMWRAIEDFLAEHLGGRSGGFDFRQLLHPADFPGG